MKIGLDIHGVINKNPEKLIPFANEMRKDGHLVYIITGETISDSLIYELLEYNNGEKFWDKLISIQDTLLENGCLYYINEFGRPAFDELLWNSFKGKYCEENSIDIMIDDTPEYGKYFNPKKTFFALYNG